MRPIHWVWSGIVGLIIGLIARAILPGSDNMGLIATMVVGILGSFVGGFIGGLMKKPEGESSFHTAGFLMSIVGAVVLLILWRIVG